jgi:oxalate decarboxylase/phosphoglucose isomerase-like protein (cupin superfamily)
MLARLRRDQRQERLQSGNNRVLTLVKVEQIMTSIDVDKVATHSFDWGVIKWFVSPDQNPGAKITFGEVVLLPGQGHARHNHPHSEEILYVLSGAGEQIVDDKAPFMVHPGDTIYIPTAIYHSTVNKGWEPLRLLALYNPGGAERALADLPDYRITPGGRFVGLRRTD